MKIKTKPVIGDLYILEDVQYNNVLADNVAVKENVIARIYGVVQKNLTIGKNAIVYMHGKVNGEIINNGGTVHIFGAGGIVKTIT